MYICTMFPKLGLFVLFLRFYITNCDEEFFLIHKYDDNQEYYCITNTSYGLTWINNEDFNTFSNETQKSDFFPKLKNNVNWIYERTYDDYYSPRLVTALVTDRRWEELRVYKTTHFNEADGKLNFINIFTIKQKNFDISFSLRIENEAHIFLCDGDNVTNSNCYWFLLEAFHGTKTLLRKCSTGEISDQNTVLSPDSCKNSVSELPLSNYLSSKFWTHLNVIKENGSLYLYVNDWHGEGNLWFDDIEPLNITHIFIHSKYVDGLWKFHIIKPDIFITEESEGIELGSPIDVIEESICVNFFIHLCEECKLKISLHDTEGNILDTTIYRGSVFNTWEEIRLVKNDIKSKKVLLIVDTFALSSSQQYWVLDKFRLCHQQEFRIISSKLPLNCQLVDYFGRIISDENNRPSFEQNYHNKQVNCPENTVGSSCIPCFWSSSRICGRAKICENFENSSFCSCSFGYNGTNCTRCENGFYGHNCAQKCVFPHSICDNVNGMVVTCTDNYSGSQCEIRPAIVFAKSPTIKLTQSGEIIFSLSNFEVINGTYDRPTHYTIQYQKAENEFPKWFEYNRKFILRVDNSVKIENLEPKTKYLIRGVIITQSGEKFDDARIPYTEFRTPCDAFNADDFFVQGSNISAELILTTAKINTVCKFEASINGTDVYKSNITKNSVYFKNLIPFTYYEIRVRNKFVVVRKTFQTCEGIPDEVENLSFESLGPNTVNLTWKEPFQTYGLPIQYIVKYQYVAAIKCKQNSISVEKSIAINTTETSLIIANLTSFSTYLFTVSASNLKFEGNSRSIFHVTPGISEIIYDYEIPKLHSIIPKNVSVDIKFSLNCSDIRGDIFLNVMMTCLNPWCNNATEYVAYDFNNNVYTLKNVTALSNYSLIIIQFCRNNATCSNKTIKIEYQTAVSIPTVLKELSVYSKNETSISLRWKSPYSPMDVPKFFTICYNVCNKSRTHCNTVTGSPCKIWMNYSCFTLHDLKRNRNYCIKIQTRNRNVEYLSPARSFEVFTSIEPSKPPYDLEFQWLQNNDLELKWKHPNETNGDIKSFKISLNVQNSNVNNSYFSKMFRVENYRLMYFYKIGAKHFLPSTKYQIRIAADNGRLGEEFISQDFFSPPIIPVLTKKPLFSSTETTIKIQLLPAYNSKVLICVTNNNSDLELQKYEREFNFTIPNCHLVCEATLHKFKNFTFIMGNAGQNTCDIANPNPPLIPKSVYNITIILTTTAFNYSRYSMYSSLVETLGESFFPIFYVFVFAIIIINTILGATALFLCFRKKTPQNSAPGQEIPLISCRETTQATRSCESKKTEILEVAKFAQYVKTNLENGQLVHQHQIMLQKVSSSTYEKVNTNLFCDYIDVHFKNIDKRISKAYIVTEMPQPHNVSEFWKIVWNENVHNIIFFDNGCVTAEDSTKLYWPVQNIASIYHNITIQLVFSQTYTHHICRKFVMTCREESRQINQFCFSSWLDSPPVFAVFFEKIKNIELDEKSPIVVHSNSGLKETGFVLLCDICLKTAYKEDSFDVFRTARNLALCSYELMSDTRYYLLAHLVIFENIFATDTRFKYNSLQLPSVTKEDLHEQFKHMTDMLWINYFANTIKHGVLHTSTLTPDSTNDEHEYTYVDNINTINVDCFQSTRKFLVTMLPTRYNLQQFWKMVQEQNISKIVVLNQSPRTKENFIWLPKEQCPELKVSKTVIVKHKHKKTSKGYILTSVDLEDNAKTSTIDVFSLSIWSPKDDCPDSNSDFVHFCVETCNVLQKSNCTLVTCCDGITACGLFIAMLYNITMIKNGECNIYTAVRILKSYHPKFIKNENQFLFLWKAVENYMKEVEFYAR